MTAHRTRTRRPKALRRGAVAVIAVATTVTATATAHASPTASPAPTGVCTPLHLVVVPGTSEIDENSSSDTDSGFFSRVTIPAMIDANSGDSPTLERSYVPYPASFGGKPGDRSTDTYAQSVETGIDNATAMIDAISQRCPGTRVFLSGYSQGAQVASELIRRIGAGTGPIDPDRLAGAALFSDPTRGHGEPVLGTGTGTRSPGPAPGTDGTAVQSVQLAPTIAATPPTGGGIAPSNMKTDFGVVAGRVASFCTAGDLACDTPANAPAARLVANIAGQSSMDTRDPVRILGDVSTAVGRSALLTGASVVNDNVHFDRSAGQFEITTAPKTVLEKMATYSDPTAVTDDAAVAEAVGAVTKIAGMAIGAAITVARDVLTADTIGQLATVGLTDPPAALAVLAAKIGVSAVKLVPPATIDSGVNVAFDEVRRTVDDNAALAQLVTDTAYWNTNVKHGSYDGVPVGAHGETPVQLAVQWIVALAADITSDTTLAENVGPDRRDRAELLSTSDTVRSATDILTPGLRPNAQVSASRPPTTPSISPTGTR